MSQLAAVTAFASVSVGASLRGLNRPLLQVTVAVHSACVRVAGVAAERLQDAFKALDAEHGGAEVIHDV